jgi:hypothetical protein
MVASISEGVVWRLHQCLLLLPSSWLPIFNLAPQNLVPALEARMISKHHHNHKEQHINLHINTMPGIIMNDASVEICETVRQLKVERDTWEAVALKYKTAFESQALRLQELQDVCFATQAELENERARHSRSETRPGSSPSHRPSTMDGAENPKTIGTATIFPRDNTAHSRQDSDDCTNPLFNRVHQCINLHNYGAATVEIERLLRGPLSPKARAEGLLLKSSILRATGPDELYDALAACSEALELCDRISDLEFFLPRIQYQRGVLYYQLRMLHQAREAFGTIKAGHVFSDKANRLRTSCDEEIRIQRVAGRRSGFDENRTFDEGLVVQLDDKMNVSVGKTIKSLSTLIIYLASASPCKCTASSSDCEIQAHVTSAALGQW